MGANLMDKKAMSSLSYGLFVLGAKDGGNVNACITNTCMQVASEPTRLAVASINSNLTCEMIKKSGYFSLSVLDKTCTMDIIERFGFQSGRNVQKFKDFEYKTDKSGCPYILTQACSVFSCKVVSSENLGTHTLFVAQVEDAWVASSNAPMTYADYHNELKPKANKDSGQNDGRKIVGWRCKICGYEYMGEELPDDFECPLCGHPKEDFEPIYG